jgi:hypothetical protein
MKFIFRALLLALVAGGAYIYWQKHLKTIPDPAPEEALIPLTPKLPDLTARTWTNQSGRTFEGELVSAKADQIFIRRKTDSLCFLLNKSDLSADDQTFIDAQIDIARQTDAFDAKSVPDVHILCRKLGIKGYTTRVFDPKSVSGWRTDRFDPVYWFFISSKLHAKDAGEFWVRVDEATYSAHKEGALLRDEHVRNFRNQRGEFGNKLNWSRPSVTLAEVTYGPKGVGYNVTGSILKYASEDRLPIEIQPELFGLPPHLPAIWELTVAWRTSTGEIRRTIRDGSVLTWP